MRVHQVRLTNVRCHRQLSVDLGRGVTVLWGANAVGKTTVLEAIVLALLGRSPRTYRLADCISAGEEFLRVEVSVAADSEQETRKTSLAIAVARGGERKAFCNGVQLRDRAGTSGGAGLRAPGVPVVAGSLLTFFPDDLRVVKGGPHRRRDFLDGLLGLVSPEYAAESAHYHRALAQRNALLQRPAEADEFEPWEALLALEGSRIVEERARGLEQFAPLFARLFATLAACPEEVVHLLYRTNTADLDEPAYRAALRQQRAVDRRRGFTHTGPHRDDLRFLAGSVDLRDAGSQGEQRMAQLALVLAGAEWLGQREGDSPVLLLDDVMSELDARRRRTLMSLLLAGGQSIITTTDLHYFEAAEIEQVSVVQVGE